mgnify:CR=1 FL=1
MIFIPNRIINLLKKLYLYNFFKKIYKIIFKKFLSLEIKTLENFILKNFVDIKFGGIIDVGAHKGDKTKIFLKFFPNDNYFLFEPYIDYYQILKKKFENKKNFKIFKKGVSEKSSEKIFYTSSNKMYAEGFSLNKNKYLENEEKIEVVNLDSISFREKIKLIKIDAEGHEPEILLGASQLISRDSPVLLIETSNYTHEKIKKILLKLDYILLIYEYYIIKDKLVDYRSLGDLTKLNQNQVISNDRFEKKFYSINKMQNNLELLTNSFAIPKSKQDLITLKINKLN